MIDLETAESRALDAAEDLFYRRGVHAVAEEARTHKEGFRRILRELSAAAGHGDDVAEQSLLLAEGAIVTAAITGNADTAHQARAAAAKLLN
ncbi:hypothetical protein [Actinophytocola sp. NPDC049390]|uniref:hypothetical protein n=1 Tax=Actinophytocola sp. NPDC049390 TaxID=3363894 RepID=UPI003798F73C